MVVLVPQSEFGHAPPPATPYSIATHLPTWRAAEQLRDGDPALMAKLVHIYPRFMPMHYAKELAGAIGQKLGFTAHGILMYLDPAMWTYTRRHIQDPHREDHVLKPEDVEFRCVEVAGHRLYVVIFQPQHMKGVTLSWGLPGIGLSIRGSEKLLEGVDGMEEVSFESWEQPPAPTWTPETEAHGGLRDRISGLMHRAARDPAKVTCTPGDVYLYPSGMAAVTRAVNLLIKYRPGTIVLMGLVFHNTFEYLKEDCPHDLEQWPTFDDESLDVFEKWLDAEASKGRPVSYVFVEAPCNPNAEFPDLYRLKKLSEKHGFVFIVDDTIGGFANIDILDASDMALTSLTKSFNGQANTMGGSIVLNPLSPHYAALSRDFKATFHNELFHVDATVILENSKDLLQRQPVHDRNARAMAEFLHATITDPESPIVKVLYPSVLPCKKYYDQFHRRSTPELPEPGYGGLLTVDFESVATAAAFYDNNGFYASPHLGAPVSLQLPYSMTRLSKKPEDKEFFAKMGSMEASIRFAAGLEAEEDIIDTIKVALEAAKEANRNPGKAKEAETEAEGEAKAA